MNGGGKDKRDCDNYGTIKSKWNEIESQLETIELNKNLQFKGKILKFENENYVTIDEPQTFGQHLGIKMQTLFPSDYFNKKITKYHCEPFRNKDSHKKIKDFVKDYNIEEEYEKKSNEYESMNDYFTRKYKPEFYKCEKPIDDVKIFRSPATSYTTIYNTVDESKKIWIKDHNYTIGKMIYGDGTILEGEYTTIINRLAPAHYHRFHMPINGIITNVRYIPGTLLSVNPDVVQSGKSVYSGNKRVSLEIKTDNFGIIHMVIIGATCVGSIQLLHERANGENISEHEKPPDKNLASFNEQIAKDSNNKHEITNFGKVINQSDGLGYFQYGGSTIVTLLKNDNIKKITYNPVISNLSKRSIEFEVTVMDPLIIF